MFGKYVRSNYLWPMFVQVFRMLFPHHGNQEMKLLLSANLITMHAYQNISPRILGGKNRQKNTRADKANVLR